MALPPALSKLNTKDMKKIRGAAEVILELGVTKLDDIEKLQEMLEVVHNFGINKVDDVAELAKNIRKHEKPVKQEYKQWIGKVDLPEAYEKKGCRIKDTAKRGISLRQLQDLGVLIEKVLTTPDVEIKGRDGEPQTWEVANLYTINSYFVEPLTWKDQVSFVELVAESVQVPLWFISHWWGTPFWQTLRMLGLHHETRKLQQESYYWMCTFANNQHELDKELGGELSDTPFLRVLRSDTCSGTVALMDKDATPFSRIWCVLEAFEAMKLELPYDMGAWITEGSMGRGGKKSAAQASLLLDDKVGTTTCEDKDLDWSFPWVVAKAAAKTEVKNANSSREEDKSLILRYIDGKEEELDRRIHQRMSKTALYGFILDGNLPMTEKLLREFPELLDEPLLQRTGATATFMAAQEGHLDCLKLLVASRADVDKSMTNDGATPTFIAAQKRNLECLKLLVASRADVDKSKTNDGTTPTFMAAQKGNLECLNFLIASRADVDKSKTDAGATPTFIAAAKGNLECLNVLIASRADVDKSTTDNGATPTFIAAAKGNLECLRLLVASRADVDKSKTDSGKSPTFIAAEKENLDVLRLLIASRADLEKRLKETGATALACARSQGREEIVQELLRAGAIDE